MKLKDGFYVRKIEDTVVAVPTGKLVNEFNCIINLNKIGKFIWELLENDITEEEIEKKLMEEFNLTKEDAQKKANEFIGELEANKFLEE